MACCPQCGLTAELLLAEGRLGCAQCYQTFARLVEKAIESLHGVPVPDAPYPWPTKRAVPHPE